MTQGLRGSIEEADMSQMDMDDLVVIRTKIKKLSCTKGKKGEWVKEGRKNTPRTQAKGKERTRG